jgi:hypothetical protein
MAAGPSQRIDPRVLVLASNLATLIPVEIAAAGLNGLPGSPLLTAAAQGSIVEYEV